MSVLQQRSDGLKSSVPNSFGRCCLQAGSKSDFQSSARNRNPVGHLLHAQRAMSVVVDIPQRFKNVFLMMFQSERRFAFLDSVRQNCSSVIGRLAAVHQSFQFCGCQISDAFRTLADVRNGNRRHLRHQRIVLNGQHRHVLRNPEIYFRTRQDDFASNSRRPRDNTCGLRQRDQPPCQRLPIEVGSVCRASIGENVGSQCVTIRQHSPFNNTVHRIGIPVAQRSPDIANRLGKLPQKKFGGRRGTGFWIRNDFGKSQAVTTVPRNVDRWLRTKFQRITNPRVVDTRDHTTTAPSLRQKQAFGIEPQVPVRIVSCARCDTFDRLAAPVAFVQNQNGHFARLDGRTMLCNHSFCFSQKRPTRCRGTDTWTERFAMNLNCGGQDGEALFACWQLQCGLNRQRLVVDQAVEKWNDWGAGGVRGKATRMISV